MPVLEVHTTYAASFFPKDFIHRLADAGASILQRPRKFTGPYLNTDRQLFTGEDCTDPVFLLRVFCANNFEDEDKNREIIKKFVDFFTSEMGIPDESIRILLTSGPNHNVGMPGGTLVSDILRAKEKDEMKEQDGSH